MYVEQQVSAMYTSWLYFHTLAAKYLWYNVENGNNRSCIIFKQIIKILILKYTQKKKYPSSIKHLYGFAGVGEKMHDTTYEYKSCFSIFMLTCWQSSGSYYTRKHIKICLLSQITSYERFRKEKSHFSDILSMCLLYEHGGFMDRCDCICYASHPWKKFFKNRYLQWQPILIQITFLKQNGWIYFKVLLKSTMQFCTQLFFQYWEKEQTFELLLIDYVISIAKTNLASVRRSLNSIPTDHSQILDLENMMNKYNVNSFKTLWDNKSFINSAIRINTHNNQYTNKGVRTLYHMLISK